MFRVTRVYRFSASHRLHAPGLSADENREIFGKCNNPFGHGHNYVVEVSVRGPADAVSGRAVDLNVLDGLVERTVVRPFHHRNLNLEVPAFASAVPTTENLALEIQDRLQRCWQTAFPGSWPVLEKVRIAETENNIFEIGN